MARMRKCLLFLTLASTPGSACGSPPANDPPPANEAPADPAGPSGGRCDQAALKVAADATDAMLAAWKPADGVAPDYRLAVRGLRDACPQLAPGFAFFLEYSVHPVPDVRSHELKMTLPLRDDPDGLGPLLARCPNLRDLTARTAELPADQRTGVVYDGCKFSDVGLFTPAELPPTLDDPQGFHGHALYLWLLADGAPPAVARSLARPITAGSDYNLRTLANGGDDLRIPAVTRGAATSSFAAPLHIDAHSVRFDDRLLVRLTAGALDPPDHNQGLVGNAFDVFAEHIDRARPLAEQGGDSLALLLVADRKTPWATAGRIAYTATRAEFRQIRVQALGPDPMRPLVDVPLYTRGDPPIANLRIDPDALSVHCLARASAPDLAGLPAAITACGGTVRLLAAPNTAWQRVVDVLVALADAKIAVHDLVPPT